MIKIRVGSDRLKRTIIDFVIGLKTIKIQPMNLKWRNNKYICLTLITVLFCSINGLASDGSLAKIENRKESSQSIQQEALVQDTTQSLANDGNIIPVLYGNKELTNITGAIGHIKGEVVKNIAGTNRINSLTGMLAGLIVQQEDGMPGKENAKIFLRGRSSFGVSGSQALVLVDGIETEITQVSPYDIESVTVLKDAVATAIYGLRGANGIILITTKRGKEGQIKVNVNAQASLVKPSDFPQFLGAADYATLYNEALTNEGGLPMYTNEDISLYQNGSNPFTHPNNNYISDYMQEQTIQQHYNLDISGGNKTAQYYFMAGYVNNSGVFNTDDALNTYKTNSGLDLTDIHTNLNFAINKRLTFNVDLKAKFDRRTSPGVYAGNFEGAILDNIYSTPPLAYPIFNEDESLGGTNEYRDNVFGKLNNSGYSIWNRTYLLGNFDMNWDMAGLLEGLSMRTRMGFSNYTDNLLNRSKEFAVYQPVDVLDPDTGELIETVYDKIGQDTEMVNSYNMNANNRYFNAEFGFNYAKEFGKNAISAMLLFDRQEYTPKSVQLSRIYQGLKGSFAYYYDSKYLLDVVFSVQGSEQFPEGNRYGTFPAVGAGWIVSNEDFMSDVDWISFLKLRSSYGVTGNDFNPYSSATPYFAYIENYQEGQGYPFGIPPAGNQGFYEANIQNNAITWEKASKLNVGIDLSLFNDKLSLNADYFQEKNSDILIEGANPQIFGASFWFPVGKGENKGFDGNISWTQQIGGFKYFVSANGLIAKNKIVEQAEQSRNYEWMERTGQMIGAQFGYVFDRYFTEADDLSALPDQSQLGSYQAGDLKYKDLNDDGIIDDNDMRMIAKSDLPQTFYGISGGFEVAGFDFRILLQGATDFDRFFDGNAIYEFVGGKGNVTERHLGRWQTGAGQNATYPRLGIQQVSNNRVKSDYWKEDGSYLRLKTIEFGYSFNDKLLEKVKMKKLRIYVSGYNLATWGKFDFADPEATNNLQAYPISSYLTAGVNIGF